MIDKNKIVIRNSVETDDVKLTLFVTTKKQNLIFIYML